MVRARASSKTVLSVASSVSPRNVSRKYYFLERLPPVDAMITEGLLEKPVLSLTLPRLGDPESTSGKLTLGAIEDAPTIGDISYNEIIDAPRNPDVEHRETQNRCSD